MLTQLKSILSGALNIDLAERMLGIIGPEFGPDRTGVMMAVCDAETCSTACVPIGTFASMKRQKDCTRNALEKLSRLLTSGHRTSFKYAEEVHGQYGGGVYFPEYNLIGSISGLPPEGDEAMDVFYGGVSITKEKIITGELENDAANFSSIWMQDYDAHIDEILPFCKDGKLIEKFRPEIKKILTVKDFTVHRVL